MAKEIIVEILRIRSRIAHGLPVVVVAQSADVIVVAVAFQSKKSFFGVYGFRKIVKGTTMTAALYGKSFLKFKINCLEQIPMKQFLRNSRAGQPGCL